MSERPWIAVGAASLLIVGVAGCCGRRSAPIPDPEPRESEIAEDAGAGATRSAEAQEPPRFGGCDEDNKQIYVVTDDYRLVRFLPVKRLFHPIGKVGCAASGRASPYSMAVDRHGMAYVLYNSGELFKVSTRDARCEKTTFAEGQQGMKLFGMAFVTDGPDGVSESLWVAGFEEPWRLAKIDVPSMKMQAPLAVKGKGGSFELTGRGDGRVFGFDPEPPARIVEIDTASGAISQDRRVKGLPKCQSWAVAQYWGDFWVFCDNQLTRYSLKDDSSEVVQADTGYRIVGAGVSTCAPSSKP